MKQMFDVNVSDKAF